jgi:hypothetical protein
MLRNQWLPLVEPSVMDDILVALTFSSEHVLFSIVIGSCSDFITFQTFWHSGAAVLVREIERSRCTDDYTDDYANIQVIQSDLAMILRCMGLFNPTDPEISEFRVLYFVPLR